MLNRFVVKQTTTNKNKNNNKTLFLHTTSVIPFYSPVPLDGLWTFFFSFPITVIYLLLNIYMLTSPQS